MVREVASWILIAVLIHEPHQTPLESLPLSLIIHDAVTVHVRDAPVFFKVAVEGASRERKKKVGLDPAKLMLLRAWSRFPATWTLRREHGNYIEL